MKIEKFRGFLSIFRLPFSIIWRDDQTKIPCSSLLITLGATASGKTLSSHSIEGDFLSFVQHLLLHIFCVIMIWN